MDAGAWWRADRRLRRSRQTALPEASAHTIRGVMTSDEAVRPAQHEVGSVNAENPWPGLLAFGETDQGFFQGRRTETEDLFRLVMRERLVVLFGLSGLGKSS